MKVKVAQSCPTLCNSMDYTVHGILQARILEWVAFPFSRGIFQTQGSYPGLPHCRWILYQLSHKGSITILECGAYPFSSRSSWSWNQTRVSCIAGGVFTNWAIREANCKYGWIYLNMYGPVRSLFLPGSTVTVSTVVCTSECGTKQMPIIDPHHGWLNGKESVCLKAGDVCVWSFGQEDSLENKMATHSGILARKSPWTDSTGGIQSMESQKCWTILSD